MWYLGSIERPTTSRGFTKGMLRYLIWSAVVLSPFASSIIPRCRSHADVNTLLSEDVDSPQWKAIWNHTCSHKVAPYCTKNITVSYYEMRPFTRKTQFKSSPQGLLQKILGMALAECCGNCLSISYRPVENRTALISVPNKNNSDVLFPVFSQGRFYQYNSTLPILTLPVIHMSGAMFITKSSISAKIFAKEVVEAILDIWPLLGVGILLAFAAGVVIWIIDTWWNKEHFPRRFVTGAFEGFWWAFVSMTTVGYGDRVPKSVLGRLFGVIWILTGMTICSLMTAALTTAIGTVAARQRPSIERGNIGILRDRVFEKSILMLGNAEKIYKDTLEELVEAVQAGEIDGMLLDSYTAKTFKNSILVEEDLYVNSIIHDTEESYLGVTIYDRGLHELMQEYFEFNKDSIKDFVYEDFKSLDETQDRTITANLIFTTNSGMFAPVVYTCTVILALSLLIGGSYELYQMQKTKIIKRKRESFRVTVKSLRKEEENMTAELELLIKKWEKELLGKIDSYHLEGLFTKSNSTFANVVVKLATKSQSSPKTGATTADDDEVEEEFKDATEEQSPNKVNRQKQVKKKPKRLTKRKKKIEPVVYDEQVDGDESPTSYDGKYIRLKDMQHDVTDGVIDPENVVSTKPKKNNSTLKKKKKKAKKQLVTDEDASEIEDSRDPSEKAGISKPKENNVMVKKYGTTNTTSTVPHTRRLPPLNRAEEIV